MEYAALRKEMVEAQLIRRGIHDRRLLQAFLKVERHLFVPAEAREKAYGDYPLPLGENQTISQPYMVALMTQCLRLNGTEKVLEIGTGSGYQCAILAELSGQVFTIERNALLAKPAQELLQRLGYSAAKVTCLIADGSLGWEKEAPFDRIIVTAAAPAVPPPLAEQLAEGGLMAVPIGEHWSQVLKLFRKHNGQLTAEDIAACTFVPLIGRYGQR